jgi:hypothetical protein
VDEPVKRVRIGGASAFWGDSAVSVPQLVRGGELDFLSFDYLAELTMSILARARAKDPSAGWATDFVDGALADTLAEIASRRIRIVSNAGGVNPRACAAALERHAAEAGVSLRVAVVEGDDVLALADGLRARHVSRRAAARASAQRECVSRRVSDCGGAGPRRRRRNHRPLRRQRASAGRVDQRIRLEAR